LICRYFLLDKYFINNTNSTDYKVALRLPVRSCRLVNFSNNLSGMNTQHNNEQLISETKNTTAKFINEKKYNDSVKGFKILTLEQMEIPDPLYNMTPDKINHFEIIWIKKGKGVLRVDDQHYDLADNFIYCIAPGNTRKYVSNSGIQGYYISFTSEFIRLFQRHPADYVWSEQHFNTTAIFINKEIQYELEVIAEKMKREYNNYFSRRQELLKGLLDIFMIYFSRNLKEACSVILHTREEELVREFMSLLKKNFMEKKMVRDYASSLCVTPNYLNRIIKKITGFTASYHIQQEIVTEAKKSAMRSGINMKEIAYYLGFETPAHFSKFFKNICGINFTEYKKGTFI
jgi:AraC family transcriptional regulator, transcriptional activator of pobA